MLRKRLANERGPTRFRWLESRHTFSFGGYFHPRHTGFGPLRVINEDKVIPGAGFETHSHRNMEIISYVLKGELAHKDSTGTGSVIRPGDVQIMSAGRGIAHSEYNRSKGKHLHFLQIWVEPNVRDAKPGYQQKTFPAREMAGKFRTVISPDGESGSLLIRQDARMLAGRFEIGDSLEIPVSKSRAYWFQMASGKVRINKETAAAGDGIAVQGESKLVLETVETAEILLFDLPEGAA